MKLTVHLHTILQQQTSHGRRSQLEITLPEGSTVQDLINTLNITLPPDSLLLVVNGRMAEAETALQDGDTVNLMPAISGGNTLFTRTSFKE